MSDYWDRVLDRRLSRRRALAAAGVASAGAALLAACGGSDKGSSSNGGANASSQLLPITDETKTLKRGGIFAAIQISPVTLDPHLAGGQVAFSWHAYQQLFRLKQGYLQRSPGEFEGEAADTYEFSPDKLTLTIKLKRGLLFAPKPPVNARAVDSQDVLFSWNRYVGFSPRRDELSNATNPKAPVLSLTAPDPATVVIKLKEPNSAILGGFAGTQSGTPYIVPRESDGKQMDLKGQSLGSGPFYLTEYNPSANSKWRKNPGYKVADARDLPYIDGIDYFDLPEYAAQLAQFRSGNVIDWFFGVGTDDVLPMKRDIPAMEVMDNDLATSQARMFFGLQDGSPFKDERVRQAFSMSWDRDLFTEVAFNTKKFEAEGLPVTKAWDSALPANAFAGWWMDPQGKDFGPNAKYLKFDLAEAKKLLTAAAAPSPVEHDLFYALTFPPVFYKHKDIITAMIGESKLFKPNVKELNFATEWTPTFKLNKGQFKGMGFELDTNELDLGFDLQSHYNSAGSRFFGGDQNMDDLTNALLREFDPKKRIGLAQDVQRYDATKVFRPRATSASTFRISWPAQRNRLVWQGNAGYAGVANRFLADIWLDQDKAPFKR